MPKKIYIDPGHGGTYAQGVARCGTYNVGATGQFTGQLEKNTALDIAFWLKAYLEIVMGATVYMSRTDDSAVCLGERAAEANSLGADIFVSLHHNGSSNSSVQGASTHWYKSQDKALAESIIDTLLTWTDFSAWGNGLWQNNYQVLRETNMPAVLIENGFLSNEHDDTYVYGTGTNYGQNPINYNRRDIAYAIYRGIEEYFNS